MGVPWHANMTMNRVPNAHCIPGQICEGWEEERVNALCGFCHPGVRRKLCPLLCAT